MGRIFKRTDGRSDKWYIEYRDQYGQRKYETFVDKRKAEQVLKKRETEIYEDKYFDIRKERKIKFDEILNQYLEYAKVNKKSFKKNYELFSRPMQKFFNGKYIGSITPYTIEEYKAARIKNVSQTTINRELGFLKALFNKAITWRKIKNNPIREVKFFKVDNARIRYLSKEEIIRLCEQCKGYLFPIVFTALNTGMRRGEILTLKWNDVNMDQKIIYVRNTKNQEMKEIPINRFLYKVLNESKEKNKGQYVFSNGNGEPYGNVRKGFNNAVKKAGITDFRFHDLRHTFASYLVMSGVDIMTVKELLGHKTLAMTLRYSHLAPDHKRRAIENLALIWDKESDTLATQENKALLVENVSTKNIL